MHWVINQVLFYIDGVYQYNSFFAESDSSFLVGVYVEYSWLHNDLKVALIGPKLDLKYDYEVGLIVHTCLPNFKIV